MCLDGFQHQMLNFFFWAAYAYHDYVWKGEGNFEKHFSRVWTLRWSYSPFFLPSYSLNLFCGQFWVVAFDLPPWDSQRRGRLLHSVGFGRRGFCLERRSCLAQQQRKDHFLGICFGVNTCQVVARYCCVAFGNATIVWDTLRYGGNLW